MKFRFAGLILAILLANPLFYPSAADEIDFGPLFIQDKDVFGNERRRALGPVFESRRDEGGDELWAVRPLYSYAFNSAENKSRRHSFYPLWFMTDSETEMYWRFALLLLYHDYDTATPNSRYRFWLVPFYFQGRDENSLPYIAFFPIAGCIRDLWFYDEVRFAFFPLTVGTRVNEVKTVSFLWPFVARTTGGGNDRFRVFPFYGYSKLREESDKYFFMWPVWTYARYNYPQSPGYAYVLFPFYGRVKLENQRERMFLPPLFRFAEGTDQTQIYCPWPFIQYNSGKVNKLYFWPLWGYRTRDTSRYSFFLWPLGLRFDHTAPFYEYHRYMFFPFIYATTTRGSFDKPERTMDQPRKTFKLWPVFSCIHDTDRSRFAMLSLFPFRDYDAIERNYGSFWTIYTHSYCKGESEDELLWGLVRLRQSRSEERFSLFPLISVGRDKKSGEFNWSFLKGLIAREKTGAKRQFRLLYFLRF